MTDKEIYKELWNGYENGEEIDNLIKYFNMCLDHMNLTGHPRIDCHRMTDKQCLLIIEGLKKL